VEIMECREIQRGYTSGEGLKMFDLFMKNILHVPGNTYVAKLETLN